MPHVRAHSHLGLRLQQWAFAHAWLAVYNKLFQPNEKVNKNHKSLICFIVHAISTYDTSCLISTNLYNFYMHQFSGKSFIITFMSQTWTTQASAGCLTGLCRRSLGFTLVCSLICSPAAYLPIIVCQRFPSRRFQVRFNS